MRFREVLGRAALVGGSLLATVLLLELLLRTIPALWPRGSYGAARFSPELSLTVHGAPVIYNKIRWNRRVPNRDGFLDVNHAEQKPLGVTRVGFFGDSYVEAVQARLEDTYFRKLPREIAGHPVEAFGFGISGWGTLHSLLAYQVMGPRYGLDDVVYLFFANDPGDHYSKMQRRREPTAELSDEGIGYVVKRPPQPSNPLKERIRRFVDQRLLLARLVRVQLAVLRIRRDAANRQGVSPTLKVPDSNDWPSTWPPAMLEEATLLTRRILMQFRDLVVRDGRTFLVLYVPHGNLELRGQLTPGQSWFPWLSQTCAELGIRLLDPRERLRLQDQTGATSYDDHWSPASHATIASFLAEQLAAGFSAGR
jgi:hypothetical protein